MQKGGEGEGGGGRGGNGWGVGVGGEWEKEGTGRRGAQRLLQHLVTMFVCLGYIEGQVTTIARN